MRAWLLLLLPAMLAGCQITPKTLPVAEPAPASECRWPAGPGDGLARVVTALEEEGFLVRHTDVPLGLVSAERARRIIYHDQSIERLPGFGGYAMWDGGGRMSSGMMLGFGGVGSVNDEGTRITRVSMVVGEQQVQVSRDIRIFNWRGELRESRSASDAGFCRELRRAIEAVPAREAP